MGMTIDPGELLGYSFAKELDGDFERCTVTSIDEETNMMHLDYLNGREELIAYNELINLLNAQDEDGDQLWSNKAIKDHRKSIINGKS